MRRLHGGWWVPGKAQAVQQLFPEVSPTPSASMMFQEKILQVAKLLRSMIIIRSPFQYPELSGEKDCICRMEKLYKEKDPKTGNGVIALHARKQIN